MPRLGTAVNMEIEGEGDIRDDYCKYMFDLNNCIDEGKGKQTKKKDYELIGSKLCNFKILSEYVNEAVGIRFGI